MWQNLIPVVELKVVVDPPLEVGDHLEEVVLQEEEVEV